MPLFTRGRIAYALIESLEQRTLLSVSAEQVIGPAFTAEIHRASISAPAPHATVVTNRLDYRPGQRAVIHGKGFAPDELVQLQVLHIDGTPNTAPEHLPWQVRANKLGRIVTSYLVGLDDLNTTLQLTAVGLTSGRSASEVFKDSGTATTTTVTTSATPAVYGQVLTFTAVVASTGATPKGTVTFLDGTTALATATLSSGTATLMTNALSSPLSVGVHSITVSYGGDSTHAASTSAVLSQTINRASTATGLTSSAGSAQTPIVQPSHIVVLVEELRSSNALGDPNMPYLNSLASTGLVYTNAHGVSSITQNGEMDYFALYSGSTQGVTDDGTGYSFTTPNIAQSLNSTPGLSFVGYSEGLPSDGSQAVLAGNSTYPDLYTRITNPMAQFTNVGPGLTVANVSKPFSEFPTNYAQLPTVSFVIPDNLDNTLGSNEAAPYAGDPTVYEPLRAAADTWLQANIAPYVQWAKANNSLLIITADHGDKQRNFNSGITTIVTGASNLFVPGTDGNYVNQYTILRSIENMYGLAPIGNTASVPGLDVNAQGQLSPSPAAVSVAAGTSVTFTATVAPIQPGGGAVPSGTVQFLINGVNFGSPVPLVNGSATSTAVSSLTAASNSITAVYSGDSNFATNTAPALIQPVSGTTTQSATTTALASSLNPSTFAQSVTFTATVASTGGTPTGSVTFSDGTTVLSTTSLNSSGVATFTTTALAATTHSITASYAGGGTFQASTSSALLQTVNASTTTALASSLNPSTAGQSVTFTATVTSAGGTPTGNITFSDGTTVLSTTSLNSSGVATFTTTSLAATTHSITAAYAGGGTFQASTSSALMQTVKASTITALASSLNPSTAGQSVTFTATVTSAGGTPTGNITFSDGTMVLDTTSLNSSGVATFTTTALAATTHSITAAYAGGGTFLASTSSALIQTVNASITTPVVNFPTGFTGATGLRLNGSAAISGSALQLTNGGTFQDASAFTSSTVNVASFTTSFNFQLSAGASTGHGFTFTIQGDGPTALGQSGGGLGYGNDYDTGAAVVTNSVAVKFDLYSNEGEGNNSTGLFTDGANPTLNASNSDLTPSGVNLHSGDTFNVQMSYNGTTLTVIITDTVTKATATQTYAINIPATVGGSMAYVGFTGATGGLTATQSILNWTFSSTSAVQPPTAPSALMATGSGTSAVLNWTNNATGITGYHLDRATNTAFTQNLVTQTLPASPAAFTDTGLTTGATYYYRLRAFNSAGDSTNSNTATVTLAAGPTVNFPTGFTGATGLQLNGSTAISGSALQLTNGGTFQDASAFTSSTVNVASFTTSFNFQLSAGASTGHGFTFTIQGEGPTALGQSGGGLGYGNDYDTGAAVVTNSVAVKFDLYSNEGEGNNSTGLFTDGANPTLNASNSDLTPSGVNLHSGDTFNVQMSYNGTTLTVIITDTVTKATATQTYAINIPATVGSSMAYVGFTGATGGLTATQSILNWTFSST